MQRAKTRAILLILSILLVISLTGCGKETLLTSDGEKWTMGFSSEEIAVPESEKPLYIAGYKQGVEITGVRDLCRASAVWMDTGDRGVLLIGIDCIGLSSGTVDEIRAQLSDFCDETGCAYINVYATHTHESADTLGLWGPVGIGGKNADYQENLVAAAAKAAKNAYQNRSEGTLFYGETEAGDILRDSRNPQVYDTKLHQFRFVSESSSGNIRIVFYGAHAESMRSGNTLVSRDYPGVMSDLIKEATGDDVLYVPGAIGGLVMTKELTAGEFDAEQNVILTGTYLAEKALAIPEEEESILTPSLRFAASTVQVPLDNPIFMYYQFLGVIDYDMRAGRSDTGYLVSAELGLLMLDDTAIALLPCELFPELYLGEGLTSDDPASLAQMAENAGIARILACGLCNNELGYVVPPSDFLVNPDLPFLDTIEDPSGENHYEETNSVGKQAAETLLDGMKQLFDLVTGR